MTLVYKSIWYEKIKFHMNNKRKWPVAAMKESKHSIQIINNWKWSSLIKIQVNKHCLRKQRTKKNQFSYKAHFKWTWTWKKQSFI